jgi:hypothetical protein
MKFVLVAIPAILLILLSSTSLPVSGVSSIDIFTPESKPFGSSFEEHIQKFWKYIISLPADKNPWNDKTGENCAVGQLETNSSVFPTRKLRIRR